MRGYFLIFLIIAVVSCKKENKENTPGQQPGGGEYFPAVKAIIQNKCTISCHAPSKGFNTGLPVILESDSDITSRAASIKAAVADSITPFNKRMPENDTLSAEQISIIVKWQAKGGKVTD